MKRVFLLLTGSMVALVANAQYARHSVVDVQNNNTTKSQFINSPKVQAAPDHLAARTSRTTLVNFITEDFSSGAGTGMPTGWTAGTYSGGTWHWDDMASTSAFSLGAMHSTTASNGWMIFDSDSLGTACGCGPSGWLQSPAYNCSAHTTVSLNFEDFYEKFNDSCSVWVSTSPTFTTYTDYPVGTNDALGVNVATANPTNVSINITSAAAGHAAVYIRFVYYGPTGGGYSWMIDDLGLSELNPHDVGIAGSFVYMPDATAYNSSLFTTPLQMVDSIYPITQLSDFGANAETNVVVNAQIFQNGTSVYNHNSTYASLPLNSFDSLVQGYASYFPNAVGNYICALSTTVTGDADATNNVDTVLFNITDTLWQQNQGNITGGFYCYKSGAGALSVFEGTRFDVPSNSVGDTVTGFGVVFDPQSVPTTGSGKVSVQLYSIQQSGTGWAYQGTSVARAITAADISSASAPPVWAYFRIDSVASGGVAQFILQPGTTYAAVIQVNGVTTDLIVDATSGPNATGFGGYYGQSDTSNDDGGLTFGSTVATGITSVPLVSMYLGHLAHSNGIKNINGNINTVNAYPNPAANELNVSFSVVNASNVSVSLTNIIGQTVATRNLANVSSGKVVFNTAELTDGVYIYTLEANGERTTGHVVIAH